MADVKNINGYNIKDETARNEIETIKASVPTKTSQLINDSEYITETELNAMNLISSGTITRIEVVSALPSTEETGVLYIVKSE